MQLGDARSGKLPDNLTGFGRALRRAGVPVDSSRIALAQQSALIVGLERRDDLRAGLRAVLISRPQDIEVFDQLFDAFFRNPELAQQLLAQMLPKAAPAHPPKRKPRNGPPLWVRPGPRGSAPQPWRFAGYNLS